MLQSDLKNRLRSLTLSQPSSSRMPCVWRIGSVLVQVSRLRLSITIWKRVCVRVSSALHLACIIWKRVCVRVSSALHLACISAVLNPYLESSQIGVWCSGTKKCSQRYQICHFCKGNISAIRTSKYFLNPIGEPWFHSLNIRYTYDSKLQLGKSWIGGWCHVILKFTVQA